MTRTSNIDIRSVFDEYLQKEQQLEQEIEKRNELRRGICNRNFTKVSDLSFSTSFSINLEKSRIRNQILLKDLEISRARLRTYASYTPTNEELQQVSSAYWSYLHKKIRGSESQ